MNNKKFNTIMFFFVLLTSYQSLAVNVSLGPGSEVTTVKILESKWMDYQIVGGQFIGSLHVKTRLVRAPFKSSSDYKANYNLAAQGSPILATFCPSNSGGYSQCHSNVPISSASCTSADGGDINKCMNRIVGSEDTLIIPINQSVSVLSNPSFCMRNYLEYPQVKASSTIGSLSLYSDPFTICGADEGAPPPIPELTGSVCSLNSQQINLSYSSTNTNVSGLRQNANLTVSCTAGEPQDYKLRLTGTNVTDGRLNFGNGVSAQVLLNGTQVAANGTGISLNGLTSQTLPVSASLVGTASAPGVTNANGILVLEAL